MYYKNQPDSQSVQNINNMTSVNGSQVNPSSMTASASTSAMDDIIKRNQAQVREVTNIMQQNIQKALDRDISLTILEDNVNNLEQSSSEFKVATKKTRSKYLWKNRKWTVIMIAVIATIVGLAILGLILGLGLQQKSTNTNNQQAPPSSG
jgi:hypothetical protein